MPYVDEQIAKILRKERMREKKAQEEEQRKQEELLIDEEEILKGIEQGECTVIDRQFVFEERTILGNRVKVYVPCKELQVQKNFQEVFIAGENEYGVGINYVISKEKEQIKSWDVYKKNIQENMEQSKMHFKWMEEGCLINGELKFQYLEFLSINGLGTLHNHMWMADTRHGRMIINLNYEHQEEKYWKPMIKAMIRKIEICR